MPRLTCRNAIFLAMWILVVLCLGSWLANPLFHAGRALADVASSKIINAPVNEFARLCQTAHFTSFHQSAILLCLALGGLPFLAKLIRPDQPLALELQSLRDHLREIKRAIPLGLACFTSSIAWNMSVHGRTSIRWPDFPWTPLLAACLLALLIECIFRGLAWRMPAAGTPFRCLYSTSLYLLFMMLWSPAEMHAWEPVLTSDRFPIVSATLAGLGGSHFLDQGLPLLLMGGALCQLRIRFHSLWLPIGLQTAYLASTAIGTSPLLSAITGTLGTALTLAFSKPTPPPDS